MKLTPHLHIVLTLRMHGYLPEILYTASLSFKHIVLLLIVFMWRADFIDVPVSLCKNIFIFIIVEKLKVINMQLQQQQHY
jgi:hypothetical protein